MAAWSNHVVGRALLELQQRAHRARASMDAARRQAQREAWTLDALLFAAQMRVARDGKRYRAAICSRRAGKSILAVVELIDQCLRRAESQCFYVGLTRDTARVDIWSDLIKRLQAHGIDYKVNLQLLQITFPNGSFIMLRGLDGRDQVEWFRGKKPDLVIVDEMQSQGSFARELVDDVVGPSLLDRGGRILLLGTPGEVEAGYWWDASQGNGFSVHSWTLRDNPNLPDVETFLAEQAERLGGEHNPKFQREYLGRWVRDPSTLVYHFDRTRNYWDVLPGPLSEAESVLGVDTGSVDADALCVWSWWPALSSELYQTAEIVETKQSTDTLIVQAASLIETFKPRAAVIDPAYGGKKAADTILERYGLVVDMAEKDRKLEYVEFFDTDIQAGRVKCMRPQVDDNGKRRGGRLADDLCVIAWDKAAREKGQRKIALRPHSDIGDAALYAHRKAKHFWHVAPPPKKDPEQERHDRILAEVRAVEAARNAPLWERENLYGPGH